MNAIELILLLFLNLPDGHCTALPASVTRISMRDYQILEWRCPGGQQFQAWQASCDNERWTRLFYLVEKRSGHGFYLNEFAETLPGDFIEVNAVYVPPCGS